MAKTTNDQVVILARRVEETLNTVFRRDSIIVASSGARATAALPMFRNKRDGMLYDEEAMVHTVAKEFGDKNFAANYALVKLAKERGLI